MDIRSLFFLCALLAAAGLFFGAIGHASPVYAETQIIIKDSRILNRKGSEIISGQIYNVKRRDLRIVTLDGKKVEIYVDDIDFNDRLSDIFSEGMSIAAEGDYKDRDEFIAVAVSFKKGGKTYTFRRQDRIPLKNFYRNYID